MAQTVRQIAARHAAHLAADRLATVRRLPPLPADLSSVFTAPPKARPVDVAALEGLARMAGRPEQARAMRLIGRLADTQR